MSRICLEERGKELALALVRVAGDARREVVHHREDALEYLVEHPVGERVGRVSRNPGGVLAHADHAAAQSLEEIAGVVEPEDLGIVASEVGRHDVLGHRRERGAVGVPGLLSGDDVGLLAGRMQRLGRFLGADVMHELAAQAIDRGRAPHGKTADRRRVLVLEEDGAGRGKTPLDLRKEELHPVHGRIEEIEGSPKEVEW